MTAARTKVVPKDIQLAGTRHAKETICALLNTQAELLKALTELHRAIGPLKGSRDSMIAYAKAGSLIDKMRGNHDS